MKATLVLVLLSLAGCATPSKFTNDPRARIVGPDYLDYIAKYSPDRHTEFYLPGFVLNRTANRDLFAGIKPAPEIEQILPLLTDLPQPSPEVKAIAGKGYPALERESGLLVFTGTNYETGLAKQPSRSFFSQFWLP